MGRFRYDDNEEDEYDVDSNNNGGSSWEFVASPGEEGALVPVENPLQHADDDENHYHGATVSDAHQPQQRTVYVVMQQDPNLYRYDIDSDDDDEHVDVYGRPRRRHRRRSSSTTCPRWLMGLVVAILSHIAWHAIHHGPPAPPPRTSLQMGPEQAFAQANPDTETLGGHDDFSASNRPSPTTKSHSSWQDYLDNHSSMFLQSTRALFWDTPLHVTSWWYRYWQDEVRQRINDYNKPQYCSVSLSSTVDERHERMERLVVQMSTTSTSTTTTGLESDDDDTTSSLSHGMFFAKGQPLAIRAVADALHTWRPRKSVHSSSSSSLPFPPLLLFSSAMTSGLAMKDLGTILSHVLISADECENKIVTRRRRQRLRPLLHLKAASDWDQAALAQQILNHVQEWSTSSTDAGGGVVVLQHVDQLAPNVLAWLVGELSTPPSPSPHGSFPSSTSSSSLPSLYMHCHNLIFLFTSETIGKASIVRSIRQAATSSAYAAMAGKKPPLVPVHDDDDEDDSTTTTSSQGYRPCDLVNTMSRPSLTLDIQHELQTHLAGAGGAASIATSMDAILPFLPLTEVDLMELVPRRLQQLWNETILSSSLNNGPAQEQQLQQLVATPAAVQALVHERNVEYIVWKTALNGGSTPKGTKAGSSSGAAASAPRIPVTLMTFSSTGADPVERHLQAIQVHWERCLLQKMTTAMSLNSPVDDKRKHTKPEAAQSFTKVWLLDTVNTTTTTGQQRGVLSECQSGEPPAVELMPATTSDDDCVEVCSFPLVSQ